MSSPPIAHHSPLRPELTTDTVEAHGRRNVGDGMGARRRCRAPVVRMPA
jgi:hypothetical protein